MGDYVVDSEDEVEVVDDECIICDEATARKCAICNDILICSMNCQQIAVIDDVNSDHFDMCVADTTADTFYKDVLSNRIPKDVQTIDDFKFNWLYKITDRRKLLEIYTTIIRKADVTPREMDIWVAEKKLFERIAMLVYTCPKLMSLEDVRWFKGTNIWTFGLNKTTQAVFQDIISIQERFRRVMERI
ncbi:hypothetical protein CGCA056_v007376 [Colletotrichum aenigma]|uniref:uncharacterized protein n=1 Tax=Colletotrichum aenigma TaxID=1215731 RepID=UPI001872D2CF|nr:uncharacterized protein CGCA056_v007376 [Colletotrichum aenigma]KAF5522576.1 hypothetical protein CGCA056_v007376 [Colletotrichum aenigma]